MLCHVLCRLQAVFTLAEGSKRCFVPKGSNVVAEGETGEESRGSQKSKKRASSFAFQARLAGSSVPSRSGLRSQDADALVIIVNGVASVLKKASVQTLL